MLQMGSAEPAGKALAQRYLGLGAGWGRLLGSPGAFGVPRGSGQLSCWGEARLPGAGRGESWRGAQLYCFQVVAPSFLIKIKSS